MKNIRVKLDKIIEEKQEFNILLPSTSTGQEDTGKGTETYIHNSEEIEMIGREREKKEILFKVLLEYEDPKGFVIPIVGLGGMGKTTIAKFVYTAKETNMFDVKAWVHVSMDFNVKKIITSIISQVEGSIPPSNATLQHLISHLDRILCGKFYLIVLDDLWEETIHNLKELMNMLQSGKKGSKIIVTTRSEMVVSTLSTISSSYYHIFDPIKLDGMSDDECWSIMKPRNLEKGQAIDIVHIGKQIAQRCNGVPIVAKTLGYMMQKNCTREAWLEIRSSNILDIKGDDKGILKGLLLSYYHMPPELKLCFMYCSIFPKSHDIDHDCLIQQWIALGFIQDSNGQQSLQKLGREYVNEFLGMSFLTKLTPTVSVLCNCEIIIVCLEKI
jgi:aquaporin TIP